MDDYSDDSHDWDNLTLDEIMRKEERRIKNKGAENYTMLKQVIAKLAQNET